MPILATKLYIPQTRAKLVTRYRLNERLNEGLHYKLTLVSAPAGFGKTTLVSGWVSDSKHNAAWLSLDKEDNDPQRFLVYLIEALQVIEPNIGAEILGAIRSSQAPPGKSILTALLNEIATIDEDTTIVLDDYHAIDSKQVDEMIMFFLEHLPPKIHFIITTREDPQLSLARLRASGQLSELRAADLRFNTAEATEFLNQTMELNLSVEDVVTLENRTEGWIAGLQLAALSMKGNTDNKSFIESFSGSNRFVLDYLVEEVLQRQPESIQKFLLQTSILDRVCAPLSDTVLGEPPGTSQKALRFLEQANLFIIPLDDERHWYRYHHLFAELLRQRLIQTANFSQENGNILNVAELYSRASHWYETQGLEVEAFKYAVAANDIERAERLVEGKGMPLYFRGAMTPVLQWLDSLPETVLDTKPSLQVMYASALLLTGKPSAIEEKVSAAERALREFEEDEKTRDLKGQIAALRALAAASRNEVQSIIDLSRLALDYLHPDNQSVRTITMLGLGMAYELQNDREAAKKVYHEAIASAETTGNYMVKIAASNSLGEIYESENQLVTANELYESGINNTEETAKWTTSVSHLGIARINFEWNDLDNAERHCQLYKELSKLMEVECEANVAGEVLAVRLKLARRDIEGAVGALEKAEQFVRNHNIFNQMGEVAAAKVEVLLMQGEVEAAYGLAETHDSPLSKARVFIAQDKLDDALAILKHYHAAMKEKDCKSEQLKAMVLQAVALYAADKNDKAVQMLADALIMAEPGGFIRIFLNAGPTMAELLEEMSSLKIMPDYVARLIAAFKADEQSIKERRIESYPIDHEPADSKMSLVEPLSQRELEVLHLIAQGLSNHEICKRLFLSLSTVKGHNLRIFSKLQVQRRTEAVARARELGVI